MPVIVVVVQFEAFWKLKFCFAFGAMAFLSAPDEHGVKHLFTPMRLHVTASWSLLVFGKYCCSEDWHPCSVMLQGLQIKATAERIFNVVNSFVQ